MSTTRTEAAEPAIVQAAGHYEFSKCPACGSGDGRRIFRENCEGTEVEIMVCSNCGLGFSNPRPTEEYKLLRYQQWAEQQRPWNAEAHYDHRQQLRHFDLYKRVMQLIRARVERGRLLDVGCGGGLFLIFAGVFASEHNAGINSLYEVEGAGFDPREVELSRQISGAPVHSLAELHKLSENRFDAITLLNVLEHVNRPVELLWELRRLLRPGGALVTVVPNNSLMFLRLRFGLGARPASLAASEHINHFRARPLERLLRQAGFEDISMQPALAAGSYGSMSAVPGGQRLKHATYRTLDFVTGGRAYLYSEIICIAK